MHKLGIRLKVSIIFGIVFLAIGILIEALRFHGVPFTRYKGMRAYTQEIALKNFSIIADLQKSRIVDWIHGFQDNVRFMAQSHVLIKEIISAVQLEQAYRKEGRIGNDLWAILQKEKVFIQLSEYFKTNKNVYGLFHNAVVADKYSGLIIASSNLEEIGKVSSRKDLLMELIGSGGIAIDVYPCLITQGEVDLVMAVPFVAEGIDTDISNIKDMVLIVSVNLKESLSPLTNFAAGIGNSGEIVLVDERGRVLLPLKHPLKDGAIAQPLKYQITAQPAMRASRGEEGVIEELDYRGVSVLAAYRFISLSRQEGWGMVVKCDSEEVFSYLHNARMYSLMIYIIGLLLGVMLIFIVSGKVMQPIEDMARVIREVENNDFSVRADERSDDEIGFLARAFNKMITRIAGWKSSLEEEVQARTAELNAVNQQLRANEQQLKAANQQLRASQQQLMAMNQQLMSDEKKLSDEIELRKRVEEDIRRQMHELQVFHKTSLNREERIIELKKIIKDLEEKLKAKNR